MSVCALIAEYNPFHNGHLRQINYIKNTLKADKIVVIMSGSFTQRGEPAVLDKHTRASHAIKAGADLVIELPTVFATANAEIFALGAVKTISQIPAIDTICFGVESGETESYFSLAKAMLNESKEFKSVLKTELDNGVSLARAKFNAIKALNLTTADETLISSPNNILALEYVKAIIKFGLNLKVCPLQRDNIHNDKTIKGKITSASSIRNALTINKKRKIKKCVPKFVYKDLTIPTDFNKVILSALIVTPAEEMKEILDCTEGLENRIKALAKDNNDYPSLLKKVVTKRYTESRIKRILLANLLGITADFVFKCLKSDLYLKVIAMKKGCSILSSANKNAPVLTRKADYKNLDKTASKCAEFDLTATELYNMVTGKTQNEYFTLIME